jgi:pimeloyl-ACP methyl ester carboxylesterase
MTVASRRAMESFRASDGLTLRYLVDDYTPPWDPKQVLFLLHAAMGSSSRLYRWVPILARNFIVVRPDMRGHAQSEVPGPHQFSFQRLARDVVELTVHRSPFTVYDSPLTPFTVHGFIALRIEHAAFNR